MKRTISFWDIIRSEGTARIKLIKILDHTIGGFLAWILPPAHPAVLNVSRVKRILIIRPGGIGDAVFLLPILRALKEKGYILDVLCEHRNSEVLASQKGLCAHVFRYDSPREFFRPFGIRYDAVIDTEQWHVLSAIVAYFIRTPFRRGYGGRWVRSKLFNSVREYGIDAYELDNFMALFSDFNLPDGIKVEGSYQIPDDEVIWSVQNMPARYVAIALGGSIRLRRFTKEQVLALARYCAGQGFEIVVLGGKNLSSLANKICQDASGLKVVDLTGQLSLSRTAAVIKHAWSFVGHDSGVLHLASANAISVIALFGPGNERKWGPRGRADKIVYLNIDFSSCTRFGYTFAEKDWRFSANVDSLIEAMALTVKKDYEQRPELERHSI